MEDETQNLGYEEGVNEGDGWGENEYARDDEEPVEIKEGGKRKSKRKSKRSKSKRR